MLSSARQERRLERGRGHVALVWEGEPTYAPKVKLRTANYSDSGVPEGGSSSFCSSIWALDCAWS